MIRLFNQYVSAKCLLMATMEGMLIVIAFLCGAKLRYWNDPIEFESYVQFPGFALQLAAVVVTFQICFYYADLYDLHAIRTRAAQLTCLGQSLGVASLILGTVYYLVPSLLPGRGVFVISAALVAVFVLISRVALEGVWHALAPPQNVLILGTQDLALVVARELRTREDLNIHLVGFLESRTAAAEGVTHLAGLTVFPREAELELVAAQHNISRIIVAMEDRRGALPIRELVRLRVQGVRVEDAHSTISSLSGRVGLQMVRPSWFVFSDGFHRSKFTLIAKRAIDMIFATVGLILSLPIMTFVALAIRLDSKGPAIFRQKRVGLRGECFEVLKFRSMRVATDDKVKATWAQTNDPRITRVGKVIRQFRLDELPQFVNVIRGEMSFVGPRPEQLAFVEQLRKEITYYDERHSVRPGLTGWAQVQYKYGASIEDAFRKLEYDLFYLKNMSVFFDCAIVLKTVRTVLTGWGAR